MNTLPEFSFIDIFSGCGGNSWGMMKNGDSPPLTPLLALDFEASAIDTYRRNIPNVKTIQRDIGAVKPESILKRLKLKPGKLGCLVASPPCQTYSRTNRGEKDANDHRYTLYKKLLDHIQIIMPLTILVENVPEMETCAKGAYYKDFLNSLETLGYKVDSWVVNSASYGVPQHRHRLIYLAYHKSLGKVPACATVTHGAKGLPDFVTVEEAIGDLPKRSPGDGRSWFKISDCQINDRSDYAKKLYNNEIKFVTNHFARELNETQLKRLLTLKEGQAYNDLPDDIKPNKGYDASYGRLWRSKSSPTLTTQLSYPGCGRFSHYEQNRVITIREALRLQSFDDKFRVYGSLLKQSTLVGNAVPPLLAKAFKDRIITDLIDFFGYAPPAKNMI